MGIYLNPENVDFQKSLNSEIYMIDLQYKCNTKKE